MRAGARREAAAWGITIAVGAGPTFGAVVGHLVPLVREGRIEPASETVSLNLGADRLLALGSSLLRHRDSGSAL